MTATGGRVANFGVKRGRMNKSTNEAHKSSWFQKEMMLVRIKRLLISLRCDRITGPYSTLQSSGINSPRSGGEPELLIRHSRDEMLT